MILTCPSCATRYAVDEAKFPPAGRKVRCAKCGHVWFQAGPASALDPGLIAQIASAPAAGAPAPKTAPEPAPEPAHLPERVAEAAAEPSRPLAAPTFGAVEMAHERTGWGPPLAIAAGWVVLIAVIGLIGLSAVRYRQEISAIWPQSAGVYNSLGFGVNAKGIDIVNVDYHRESEDGQVVLAVTGRIINSGARELPVPQGVRVTLSDSANHELYHWSFAPAAQTLKPGQSVPFLTRLSSPPAAARHLEVRFAKEGP
jgi:predicted Zn finger-like uncharacterized protein